MPIPDNIKVSTTSTDGSTSYQLSKDFINLKESIEAVTKSNVEKNALNLFDLISWLESKIERKSFKEIKQAKFNTLISNEALNAHMH
jgi:hypothetical protein